MSNTIEIPAMPALWDMDRLYVSQKRVSGALAGWAIHQSPYAVPENLGAAVEQFIIEWPLQNFAEVSSADLYEAVSVTIKRCPLIVAWNTPKLEGAVNERGFASIPRYDSLKPDYDFIDLDALARNVTHEIVLWAQVEASQNNFDTKKEED